MIWSGLAVLLPLLLPLPPYVSRLFAAQQSTSIMAGDAKSAKEVMSTLKKHIKGKWLKR